MSATHIAAGALVLLACIPDLRIRRIPNALTLGAAGVAIAFHAATAGVSGLAVSAGGWLVGAALFFPIFALRGMGAADVKLLAAVGAWLGPAQVIWVALITSVAGGVLGLLIALFYGYLRTALANLFSLLMQWRMSGIRPVEEMTLSGHRGPRLAYAVPIAVGTLVTLWLK
ncbi:MAG: prepilin peptidase [Acidobacteria bacterium]|nr:prepilin peptidase [Acidobacteriota bacterium]